MNEFRQALEAHLGGQMDLAALEHTLSLGLARQPQLAAAHGAYIEAIYRSGRIPGESYLVLIQAVRSFQQSRAAASSTSAGTAPPSADANTSDKTQFRAPAQPATASEAPADVTQFRAPKAPTAAPVPNVGTHTGSTGAEHTGAEPAGESASSGPSGRAPTGSRPTGSNWSDASLWAHDAAPLGPGSVIKDRFVLEEELGRGGMGVVFKARDLRKEEAQDRNPYVAIKLLNDEFRRHPESLKALQRESRKAQHLAHANVVTVYDFDRDGANVFMVMELLEGESLDRIIRDNEETGLPIERALRLTRGLCRAMAYAHEQGVVHSDFKPANAFLTKQGVVKVFDFGIARAAKRADNLTGSTTLFDPGTLGALTPTYASCEMIEGLEPDSRDDVYAIACVTYELLTGKHPFKRMSAVQARDKKMVAARPRGLKRYQWRALQRGLAFDRAQRTASAQQFLNELMPRARRPTVHIGVAAVVVVALVLTATYVPNYLAKRRERAMIDALSSGDASQLDALLLQLRSLSLEQRAAILLSERARAGLISLFESRISAVTDESGANVDYPRARALLTELQAFLPDSLAVRDLEDRLVARENDEIKRLSDLFDDYLQRGLLIDAQGPENVDTVLAALRRIDPQNQLLRDPRLLGAYAEQAGKALQAGDAGLAQALISAGLSFDPQDTILADLRDQAQRAMDEQQLLARAQSLEAALDGVLGPEADLAVLNSRRAEIDELRSIAPDSAVLANVQQLAQREVSSQSAALQSGGEPAQALALVAQYADLLPASFVDQQRQRFASMQAAAAERTAAVEQIKGRIDGLLQDHSSEASWGERLGQELRRLAVYLPAGDPYLVQARSSAAEGYIEEARTLRSAQRLTAAARMLEQAGLYAPQSADLIAERKLLADAHAAREASSQQRNRLAQVEALKNKLLVQARANEVTEALASLQELRGNLQANDTYLTAEAPEAIGSAYLRLASTAAKDGRFDNAATLAARAGEIAPKLAGVAPAQERFARYQALERTLKTAQSIDVAATRSELDRLARLDATETALVKQRLARALSARISASDDPALVERLTRAAQEIFADQQGTELLRERAPGEERLPDAALSTPVLPDAQESAAEPLARAAPTSSERTPARVAVARTATSGAEQQAIVERLPPEIACSAKLAGYGRRRQAICYDTFDGGGRGPDLVVIPAGGSSANPFALGRTEVSNADFALYCTRTGACEAPAGEADYPVTGISLEDAQNYLAWISSVSGAVYRLPTDTEWTHAVNAAGASADRSSINCLVEIGGKKVRGLALEPVQSGSANKWGLYNYLGNAQEWVVGDSFIATRGGAYSDNVSACTPEATRVHSGSADPVTGLRVLREIG